MKNGSNAQNTIKAAFTPDEVAEYLHISKTTVYRLVNKGDLPAHKVSGMLRFRKDEIESYWEATRI